jgi:hypothetical protein
VERLRQRTEDPVSCGYYAKLRCCGRVMSGYVNNKETD